MRSGPMHTPWFLNHITSHRWDGSLSSTPDPPPSIHPSPARAWADGLASTRAGPFFALGTVRLLSLSLSFSLPLSDHDWPTGMTGASIYDQ